MSDDGHKCQLQSREEGRGLSEEEEEGQTMMMGHLSLAVVHPNEVLSAVE